MKKTVKDINWDGKTAVMRCDFNVPLKDGVITDNTRIKAALPTINYLVENNAKVVIMSHLGRPKGKAVPELSLAPVAKQLAEYVDAKVNFCPSDVVVDDKVRQAAHDLSKGEILLIENVRFRIESSSNLTFTLSPSSSSSINWILEGSEKVSPPIASSGLSNSAGTLL